MNTDRLVKYMSFSELVFMDPVCASDPQPLLQVMSSDH